MNCKEIIELYGVADKSIWGSIYRRFIILIIYNCGLASKDVSSVVKLLQLLPELMPCDDCADHFRGHLAKSLQAEPFYNQKQIIQFIVGVYNAIEKSNNRAHNWSWDMIVDKYIGSDIEKAIATCNG